MKLNNSKDTMVRMFHSTFLKTNLTSKRRKVLRKQQDPSTLMASMSREEPRSEISISLKFTMPSNRETLQKSLVSSGPTSFQTSCSSEDKLINTTVFTLNFTMNQSYLDLPRTPIKKHASTFFNWPSKQDSATW